MAGSIDNDLIIVGLAARRSGICTRSDLIEAGLSPAVIDRRLAAGLLQRVGRGVYIVESLVDELTPIHRAVSLVRSAVVSDQTAGHHFHHYPLDMADHLGLVHVTVATQMNRRLEGIVLHRRRRFPPSCDVVWIDGLPVTSPARTLVDLSASVGPARLRHLVQTAIRDDHTTLDEVVACFDSVARRGVTGIARLRSVLTPMVDGAPVPGSALEAALADLLEREGIGGFEQQFRPPWFDGVHGVVDFAHPGLRIVLEADGRTWHRRDSEMAADRRRDRQATANGWVTMRVTWPEVIHRPGATGDDIRSIVAARSEVNAA